MPKSVAISFLVFTVSFYIGYWVRIDFEISEIWFKQLIPSALTYSLIGTLLGLSLGLYSKRYIFGSLEEILAINTQAFLTLVFISFLRFIELQPSYPRSIPTLASLIFIFFSLGLRIKRRLANLSESNFSGKRTNILIYGAGNLGNHIANLVSLDNRMNLVGFLDDDNEKRNLEIRGRKILGDITNLNAIVSDYSVNQIILAISALNEEKSEIIKKFCTEHSVKLKLIPSAKQLISGFHDLHELISFNEHSLLGRSQVEIDKYSIEKLISGKAILVTGAGGSIGSEIAKQISRYSPKKLLLLDRDETSLHSLELELFGTGYMNSNALLLGDIRDADAMVSLFIANKPEIVFHAAALKHLPILENFPEEAYKTNVIGTKNILNASKLVGVQTLVNISTDKAADPTSVLGKTKKIAEQLTLQASEDVKEKNSKFISVRFGNVVGSRGSVLHTFKYQIDNNLPITVTDPEATRYFMTVREAVMLVLQSAVEGKSGETLILDMGNPVKISDVAKFMIEQSGKELSIIYTGLRPGEKVHETLASKIENLETIGHPKIFHTYVDLEISNE